MEVKLDKKLINMYKEKYGVDVIDINITEDSIIEISYKDKDTIKKDIRDLEDILNELLSI